MLLQNTPGNNTYYATASGDAPDNVRFSTARKFEQRLLMWIAISPCGLSKPYFVPATSAVNSELYANECIRKKLLPFINSHHADGHYNL